MVKAILKPLDGQLKTVEIPKGKTTLGRGPFLNCSDKKVSRNHAVLELKDSGEITLTSIHVNPCFYSSDPESSPKILKKDKTQKLIAGDIFSLLPNSYRYQIVIKDEENDEDKQGHTNDVKADDSSCNGDTNKEENSEKYSEIKESKNQVNKDEDEDTKDNDSIKAESKKNEEKAKNDDKEEKDEASDEESSKIATPKRGRSAKTSEAKKTKAKIQSDEDEYNEDEEAEDEDEEEVEEESPKDKKKGKASTSSRGRPPRKATQQQKGSSAKITLDDYVESDEDMWDESEEDYKPKKRGKRRRSSESGSDWEMDQKRGRGPRKRYDSESESGSDWENEKKKKKTPRASKGGRRSLRQAPTRKSSRKARVSDESEEEEEDVNYDDGDDGEAEKRQVCKQGKSCNRKNPSHRKEFSHPGDSDYDSSADTKKKNDDQDDEEEETPPKKTKAARGRPKRESAKKASKKKSRDDDDEDEEEENVPKSRKKRGRKSESESESDFEEEEDVAELKKEAKGFIRNKKLAKV